MVNRIEHWWKDITKWKEKTENFFRSIGIHPDRAFLKDELRKYEQLLSRQLKDMTPEELMTRKQVRDEHARLMKRLYPNPVVRLARNLFKLGNTVVNRAVSAMLPDSSRSRSSQLLDRFGLPEMKQQGKYYPFPSTHSESPAKGEVMDFRIKFAEDLKGKPVIHGFEASLQNAQGKKERVFISADMPVNKYQARELLNGRSIHTGGSRWLVPDMNDRDADGRIKLREITIPGYDVRKELAQIPGIRLQGEALDKAAADLMNGKRVDVQVKAGTELKTIGLDASPLKHDFMYYLDNKKVSLDQLSGSPVKQNTKVVSIDTPKRQRQMKV